MVTIQIEFLAGRYHATPWDSQVNEGMVEWPPSPWRIMRTLIATWYGKCTDEVDETVIRSLIQKMASVLPEFYLPSSTSSHVRHFMPGYRDKDRDRVLDAFMCPLGPAYVHWPINGMSEDEAGALALLTSRTNFLGRSESWVEMKVIEGKGPEPNVRPSPIIKERDEAVRLLIPVADSDYLAWKNGEVDKEIEAIRQVRTGKGKGSLTTKAEEKERKKLSESYPENIWNSLQMDTSEMRSKGWNIPPGSAWVQYSRIKGAMSWTPPPRTSLTRADRPLLAKFGVQSSVAPSLTKAVSLAERVHDALVSLSGASPVFTGCDEQGKPLKGHRHASIYCRSAKAGGSKRGEITEVFVYCPDGFDIRERAALESLSKVWGYGGYDVALRLHGMGSPEEIDFQGDTFSEGKIWSSYTPFVATRHAKATRTGIPKRDENGLQKGTPEHDLIRLLMLEGFPRPTSVTRLTSAVVSGRPVLWQEFTRDRRHGDGLKGEDTGTGFRVEFPVPVRGPVAVGYGCHFGLGLFLPSD